jgi:hypothetical protein
MKNPFFGFLVICFAAFSVASAAPPDLITDYDEVVKQDLQVESFFEGCTFTIHNTQSAFIYNAQSLVSKEVRKCYTGNVLDPTRKDFVSLRNYSERWQTDKQHTGNVKLTSNSTYRGFTITTDNTERESNSQLRDRRDPGRQTLDVAFTYTKI